MDTTVITGIFTLSGMIIGAGATVIAAKISSNVRRKDKALKRLSSQVKAYWALEDEYVNELKEYLGKGKNLIKSEFRERVRQKGYEKPYMTSKEVEQFYDKI